MQTLNGAMIDLVIGQWMQAMNESMDAEDMNVPVKWNTFEDIERND